jgi:hypothetical protein
MPYNGIHTGAELDEGITAALAGEEYTSLLAQDFSVTNLTATPVQIDDIDLYNKIVIFGDNVVVSGSGIGMELHAKTAAVWRTANYSRMYLNNSITDYEPGTRARLDLSVSGTGMINYVLERHKTDLLQSKIDGVRANTANSTFTTTEWNDLLEVNDKLRIYCPSGSATGGILRIVGVRG